ncbi:CTP synthase [Forsythia ovata]|uniref:CTP synthase (glutamine hydrolyzing) n=1 Tax=Forsythia ovata TaxID=205694 RepID=A0ABD1R6U9_9LAMI
MFCLKQKFKNPVKHLIDLGHDVVEQKIHLVGPLAQYSLHKEGQKSIKLQKMKPNVIGSGLVNPDMVPRLEEAGLSFAGKDETGRRMEIVELPSHPYFVGVQFHPEFKSRPGKPSALFLGLVAAACSQLDAVLKKCTTKTCKLSNGTTSAHYENAPKVANGSLDSIYYNGNGLHV